MELSSLTQHRRLLLLQGPLGSFFSRLSTHLRRHGCTVHRIALNGGDWLVQPRDSVSYRSSVDHWPHFLDQFIESHEIDAVVVYGDCRHYHEVARQVCARRGVHFHAFEEGYIRPYHVTLERGGVNARSSVMGAMWRHESDAHIRLEHERWSSVFHRVVSFAILYYVAMGLGRPFFPGYRHHRQDRTLAEGWRWLRAIAPLLTDRLRGISRSVERRATRELSKKYFFVPLQLAEDSQIRHHSDYDGLLSFCREVIESFSRHGRSDQFLIFKQHPHDLMNKSLVDSIEALLEANAIKDRSFVIRSGHIPTLVRNAIGVVTINSTVGISALHHHTPLKVMGRCFFDIPGLTHQGSLDEFWGRPDAVDPALYAQFRRCIEFETQINGSFYGPFPEMDRGIDRARDLGR